MGVNEAWKRLTSAATGYGLGANQYTQHELAEAALEYARERWARRTGVQPAARRPDDGSKDSRPVVKLPPFGRQKSQPVGEVESKDLRWYLSVLQENVEDPTKERWRAANASLAQAIEAELASRGES